LGEEFDDQKPDLLSNPKLFKSRVLELMSKGLVNDLKRLLKKAP
jgi:hypothetical protein